MGGRQTWTVADAGTTLTLGGVVSGGVANSNQSSPASNPSLTIRGAGTVDLTNAGNTFTGDILVDGASLVINANTDWGGPTVISASSKTISLDNAGTLLVTASVNPGANTSTTYNLIQVLAGGGTVNISSGATLTLDDAGQLFGSGTLTKTGLGTLALRNQGTSYGGFAGNLIISAGLLQPTGGNGFNFGTTAGGTTIESGAALNLIGFSYLELEPLTISGTGLASDPQGALVNRSGTASTWTGPITMSGDSTIGSTSTGGATWGQTIERAIRALPTGG
jgi:fibronectin-binding autotransporter adhesin